MEETKKGKILRPKKRLGARRVVWLLLKTLAVVILLFALFLIGINVYLKSNKTKVFSNLPILNDGTISFGSANISLFKNFPVATLSLENITLCDAAFDKHGKPVLELQKLSVVASLQELLNGEVEIHSIDMQHGTITVFFDENGYSNLKSFFSEKTNEEQKDTKGGPVVRTDHLKATLCDINYHFTDAVKTTSIHGRIDDLSSLLHLKNKVLSAEIDMALFMEELAFQKKKGSFASNSFLSGKVKVQMEKGILYFEPFHLSINDEQFLFSGKYDTKNNSISNLVLENEETILAQARPLLPDELQQKLMPFQIVGPFYSKTTISGSFKQNDPPLIYVDFRLNDNDVTANGFSFEKTVTNGRFINRLYDSEQDRKEDGKNFKISLNDLTTIHDGFLVNSDNIFITMTPEGGPQIKAGVQVNGQPSGISKWLKNDQFFFRNGKFVLNGKVKGSLSDLNRLIVDSELELNLKKFSVIYEPSNSAFPFRQLDLYKKQGDADFTIISGTLKNGQHFRVKGGLKNLEALLFELAGQSSSDVNFVAPKIGWTDFLDLFGENGYFDGGGSKSDRQKKKSMKETIRGIQFHFQPQLSVSVDTLEYFDLLELNQFRTGVHFEDKHTLILENTSFKYGEGTVNFQATLDISEPEQTPFEFELHADKLNIAHLLPPFDYFNIKLLANMDLPDTISIDIKHKGIMDDQKGLIPHTSTGEIVFKVNKGRTLLGKIIYAPAALVKNENPEELKMFRSVKTKIALDGNPVIFNEFFKTNQFFFDKGHFVAQFEYEGDVTDFGELLNKGDGTFSLQNSEVYYKVADVTFPLSYIELDLHQDNANFNALIISGSTKHKINLTGDIQNISELVIGNTGRKIKTTVDVTSPAIEWTRFLDLFEPSGTPGPTEKTLAMKSTAKGILSTFNPDLSVWLDTFIYSEKFMLHDVQTGISLKNKDTLVLDKTGFKFYDGSVGLHGTLDLSKKNSTPFEGHFQTDDLDVAKLLESLNYLNIPSFENLEKLTGQITMNLDLSGINTDDGNGLIPAATKGLLDFELKNILIQGFGPLDALTARILMKNRFKELAFAPITNRVKIEGQDIHIPLMEIQSNAINMFLEGTYSYGDNTNIWVTVPLANLKSADRTIIPPKRGYESLKRKIYIEVITGKNGENKFKFHFRKKKFYKQRGIPEQFKMDKRMYRKLRKEQKKGG